jgi:hypothetical protein
MLDRIVTESFTVNDFLALMEEQVERHLAMVFHRLLEGHHPKLRLNLKWEKDRGMGSVS